MWDTPASLLCPRCDSSVMSSTSWWSSRLTLAIAAAMPAGDSWSPANSGGYPWTPNRIVFEHTGWLVSPRNLIPKLAILYSYMFKCPKTRSKKTWNIQKLQGWIKVNGETISASSKSILCVQHQIEKILYFGDDLYNRFVVFGHT